MDPESQSCTSSGSGSGYASFAVFFVQLLVVHTQSKFTRLLGHKDSRHHPGTAALFYDPLFQHRTDLPVYFLSVVGRDSSWGDPHGLPVVGIKWYASSVTPGVV